MKTFTTEYAEIEAQLHTIDVAAYAQTRNYKMGAVSFLSPYIARGLVTLPQVLQIVLQKNTFAAAHKFIQELAWRDYWQRVWWKYQDKIFTDFNGPQQGMMHDKMPSQVVAAATGIEAIDEAIAGLYNIGYMHNHARMYTASVVCNIAKAHWLLPARWMYYHLLDGDIASNFLSWQWVAGTRSNRQYYCNQENINKYFATAQQNTFLDFTYDGLLENAIPAVLAITTELSLSTALPPKQTPIIDQLKPTYIYNSYHLQPRWDAHVDANRILLLEPSHFKKFPVSDKVLRFILALAKNIKGIQLFTGEFSELHQFTGNSAIFYQDHPTASHYVGTKQQYPWIVNVEHPPIQSFFAFWKKIEKELVSQYQSITFAKK